MSETWLKNNDLLIKLSPYLATICFTKIEKKYVVEEWDFIYLIT